MTPLSLGGATGYATGTLAPIHDPVRLYVALRFLHGLSYSLFFTVFFQYQINVVHLQPYQQVLMGTAMEVTVFLFEVPTGIVADLYSRRLSVAIGLAMVGSSALVMGLLPAFLPFLSAQILWGIGETFISGARDAWVADEIAHGPRPEMSPTKAFLASEQGWMTGFILGMWAAVPLSSKTLALPILAGGSMMVLLGLATQLVLPERGFTRVKDDQRSTWRAMADLAKTGLRVVKGRVLFGLIILLVFVHGVASEGIDRLWTQHFLDLGTPPLNAPQVTWWAIIGTAYTALALLITGYFRSRAPLVDSGRLFRVVGGLTLALSAALVLFAFAGNFWWALVAFLVARGLRRTLDPLITGWINHHSDTSVRATMLSFQGQAHGIGEVFGGPLAALVAKLTTVPLAIASSAALMLPSLLVCVRGKKEAGSAPVPGDS